MRQRRGFGLASTDLPLLLLLASAGLAVWPAHDRDASWPALAAIAAGVGVYFVISRACGAARPWRALAGCCVIAGAAVSAYFVSQYSHLGYGEKLPYLDQAAAWLGSASPRLGSCAPDRNSVATGLEGVLFLAVGLAAAARGRAWRAAWGAAAVVLLAGLALSASRGAWLGVAVASGVWVVMRRPWVTVRPAATALIAAAPLVFGLAWVAAVIWWPEMTGSGAVAPALDRPDRVTLYRQSAFLVGDYPFTGIGLGGQFAMLLSRYALLIQVPFLTYSHNAYLQTWLELGLPGLLALAWLLTVFFVSLTVIPQLRHRTLAEAAGLGLLATFLHGIVDARQYVDLWTGLPVFVLLGLHAALIAPGETAPIKQLSLRLSAAAVLISLAIVVVATWPVGATWQANLGAVRQAATELGDTAGSPAAQADLAAAESRFRSALSTAPGHRTANLRLALMLMSGGRHEEAVQHASAALEADRVSLTTRKALGLACVWTGDLGRAEPLLRPVPGIVEELNSWEWWRTGRHEPGLALQAYRMSLMLDAGQEQVRRVTTELEQTSLPSPRPGR